MTTRLWNRLAGASPTHEVWEVFHENSKISRFADFPSDREVSARMAMQWQAVPSGHLAKVPLPGPDEMAACDLSLGEAIMRRRTPDNLSPEPIDLRRLTALLYLTAGIDRQSGQPDRPFRMAPSGGALYPLDLFVHVSRSSDLESGLYYYDPVAHALCRIAARDLSGEIARTLVQPALATDSSIQLFQAAAFARTTFKYGNRGYRFALIEAGHQAQNLNLVATALGLGCINVGGFRDHALDEFLGLDGISRSVIYASFVGRPQTDDDDPRPA